MTSVALICVTLSANSITLSSSTMPIWGNYITFNIPSAFRARVVSVKYLNFNVLVAIQRPGLIETASAISMVLVETHTQPLRAIDTP